MSTRHWQVRARYPNGAVMTFGVAASTREAAAAKAEKIAPPHGTLTVTRIYGRHHPVRRKTGMREER